MNIHQRSGQMSFLVCFHNIQHQASELKVMFIACLLLYSQVLVALRIYTRHFWTKLWIFWIKIMKLTNLASYVFPIISVFSYYCIATFMYVSGIKILIIFGTWKNIVQELNNSKQYNQLLHIKLKASLSSLTYQS